jgi:hypothetical protein
MGGKWGDSVLLKSMLLDIAGQRSRFPASDTNP